MPVRVPGGISVELKPDEHIRLVGWRQGFLFRYHDLVQDRKFFARKPIFGVIPQEGTPEESFRILSVGKEKPSRRELDMGVVDVRVGKRGVTFKPSVRGRPFRRATMGKGG